MAKNETMTSHPLPALLNQPTAQAQARWEKWIQQEIVKGKTMVSAAKAEEDNGRNLPRAIRELEYCPAATRNQEILLCGWLAIKTSAGWTRRWQARYCVLTTQVLYIFKRAPPANSKRLNALGPQITSEQAAQVIGEKYALESSNDLFGEFRDSVPMDGSASIIKIMDLPHTFQISYPSRPRLLLRAATATDADKWCSSVYIATALAGYKASQLPTLAKEYPPLIPHINDIIQGYIDKSTILRAVFLSPYHEIEKKSNINIPTVVSAQNVDYLQPIHIPLVSPYNKKNCQLTMLFADGGKVSIPLDTLHARTQSPDCAPTAHGACAGYFDGLFTVAYANYNADVHVAWKFEERRVESDVLKLDLDKNKSADFDLCKRATLQKVVHQSFSPSRTSTNDSLSLKSQPTSPSVNASPASPSVFAPPTTGSPISIASLASALPPHLDTALFVASGILMASLPGVVSVSCPRGIFSIILSYLFAACAIFVALKSKEYVKKSDVEELLKACVINNGGQQNIPFFVSLPGETTANAHSNSASANTTPTTAASNTLLTVPVLSLQVIRYVNRHSPSTALLLAGEPLTKESTYPALPNFTIATPFVEGITTDFMDMNDDILKNNADDLIDDGRFRRAFSVLNPNQLVSYDDELHLSDDTDIDNGDNDDGDETDKENLRQSRGDNKDTFNFIDPVTKERRSFNKSDVTEPRVIVSSDPFVGNVYKEAWGCWSQSDYRPILVRGSNYLKDRKKIPASPIKFPLAHCEVIAVKQAKEHCANWKNSYFKRQLARVAKLGRSDDWAPGTPLKYFIVNYLIPGSTQYNFFFYMKNPYIYPSPFPEDIVDNVQQEYHPSSPDKLAVVYPENDPFFPLMKRFLAGSDEDRTKKFKFIPNVVEGNWIVKKGVGNTPALIAKKIATKYQIDPNGQYAEVDIDVSSSSMAGRMLGLVKGYAKSIHIDQFFTIEPQEPNDLPEGLWGAVCMRNVDLNECAMENLDDLDEE